MKKPFAVMDIIRQTEQLIVVRSVRGGLVSMIPILIIGAFALIGKTLPLEAYQHAVTTFAGGFVLQLFDLVYGATFGPLALYMTFFISRAYMKLKADPLAVNGGAEAASMLAFFIMAGAYLPGFGTDNMGPKSMFLAILTGLGASSLYLALHRFFRSHRRYIFSSGVDREFTRMLSTLPPIAITVICFAVVDGLVMRFFDVDSFLALIARGFNALFAQIETGFFQGLFFVLLSSLLWFFGIHGSDTLEGAMQTYFAPGLAANQAAIASGGVPETVLTKEFFDCFVLMGGCGATICLLIAILLFSRNQARRGLGLAAAFPMLFNINELMVFGLPIIFNPTMLIPFLAVPLICYSIAYVAVSSGLVPMIASEVAWTTPVLLGGFRATGSVRGSLLQLCNVAAGTLIYLPFVRVLDRQSAENVRRNYAAFVDYFKTNEQSLTGIRLTDLNNIYGDFAKNLCADLRHGLENGLTLAYQPQYHYDGHCTGVEVLLRWRHPIHGILYPPVVVKLAEEGGFLATLEETMVLRVLSERAAVLKRFGDGVKISFNITGTTVVTPRFLQFLRQQNAKTPFRGKNLCLEVTEQAAISFNENTRAALLSMRDMGLLLAIDDFSMGQTSLHYLKDSMFDIIKLDGSLVRGLATHSNYREIISSITGLAASLNLTVLAEFVETEEQREILHNIGCDYYQGYLYSPAVFLDK
ncbi:MAG: PTS sugar transporter subunit IIC/EAL domain-containing protein [Oscillospiraceae bacterium]|nr:PTS sugar transporter subunit IIC/EAL domain-containing protein [Oscillospiraceae bacterium]